MMPRKLNIQPIECSVFLLQIAFHFQKIKLSNLRGTGGGQMQKLEPAKSAFQRSHLLLWERERAKLDACLPDGRLCKRQSDSRHQLPIDSSQLSFTRLHSPPPHFSLAFHFRPLRIWGIFFPANELYYFTNQQALESWKSANIKLTFYCLSS